MEKEEEETMSENGSREKVEEDEEKNLCICQWSKAKLEKWKEEMQCRKNMRRKIGEKVEDDERIQWWPWCPCLGKLTKWKLGKKKRKRKRRKWRKIKDTLPDPTT